MCEPLFYLVNFITVVGKYYIKQSRDDLKELSLTHFQYCLKDKLTPQSSVAWWLASLASNHKLSPLWVRVPQVAILRTCPNMTLAVERDVKPQI